jgi:hypothetical protein
MSLQVLRIRQGRGLPLVPNSLRRTQGLRATSARLTGGRIPFAEQADIPICPGGRAALELGSLWLQRRKTDQKCNAPLRGAGHREKAFRGLVRHMIVTRAGVSCRLWIGYLVSVVDRLTLHSGRRTNRFFNPSSNQRLLTFSKRLSGKHVKPLIEAHTTPRSMLPVGRICRRRLWAPRPDWPPQIKSSCARWNIESGSPARPAGSWQSDPLVQCFVLFGT